MQKVNIFGIVTGHLDSLRNSDGKFLLSDILTFYVLPVLVGVFCLLVCFKISKDAIGLSISVFSIFAALLLSVQVALYSVSLRPLSPPADQKKNKVFEKVKEERGAVIRELNNNISYLVLLSVFFITALLLAYIVNPGGVISSALCVAIYVHFFLTLLMVVKRASIVFSREYET
ncbi:hypothetical protein JP75_14280 [Devosia riboflavina]|uniref:Uncharacterized protein n=1 Tax=Devosia riboflavina TaxID=46914 RepID=A0A087M185_9HYPH|nr:hypothetical protein [Devosia riboflavina]KFL30638.1 hypothetical protein JP75_14280 [Devosia riboflavina]